MRWRCRPCRGGRPCKRRCRASCSRYTAPRGALAAGAAIRRRAGHRTALGQFFAGKPVVLVLDYLRCNTLCGRPSTISRQRSSASARRPPRFSSAWSASIRATRRPLPRQPKRVSQHLHHPAEADGWHFLTGPHPESALADTVGFPYRYDPPIDQYIHPAGFVIAAPDGTSAGICSASTRSPPTGERSRRRGARENRGVADATAAVLPRRYPQPGRYSLGIEGAFVVANLAAMIGGLAVFVALWRRRHG